MNKVHIMVPLFMNQFGSVFVIFKNKTGRSRQGVFAGRTLCNGCQQGYFHMRPVNHMKKVSDIT